MYISKPKDVIEDMQKLDVKNVISVSLIIAGLIVTIWGFNVAGQEVITKTYNGVQMELNNMASYQWNWRVFVGLGAFFTGLGLWFFPSQRLIEAESGRYS